MSQNKYEHEQYTDFYKQIISQGVLCALAYIVDLSATAVKVLISNLINGICQFFYVLWRMLFTADKYSNF